MKYVIPSVLAQTESEFKEIVRRYEQRVDMLHLDIAEGKFVPNETFRDTAAIARYPWACEYEVHLMVQAPEEELESWLDIGASGIIVHLESTAKMPWVMQAIKSHGLLVGLALNLETAIDKILPYLEDIDIAHIMSVRPGFYGSPFQPEVLERVRFLRERWPSGTIQVDGGINTETIGQVVQAGATRCIVGSALLRAKDVDLALADLETKVAGS